MAQLDLSPNYHRAACDLNIGSYSNFKVQAILLRLLRDMVGWSARVTPTATTVVSTWTRDGVSAYNDSVPTNDIGYLLSQQL
jgi:hypothetical protein